MFLHVGPPTYINPCKHGQLNMNKLFPDKEIKKVSIAVPNSKRYL
jgi:hypothetical protein